MKLLSKLHGIQNQTVPTPCAFQAEKAEDCDSGTASDEENPEVQLELLQEAMQKFRIHQLQHMNRPSSSVAPGSAAWLDNHNGPASFWTTKFGNPGLTTAMMTDSAHSNFNPIEISLARDFAGRDSRLRMSLESALSSDQESFLENSDVDQCSLDYDLDSSSMTDYEEQGSEEEDEVEEFVSTMTSSNPLSNMNNVWSTTTQTHGQVSPTANFSATANNIRISASASAPSCMLDTTKQNGCLNQCNVEVGLVASSVGVAGGTSDEEVSELLGEVVPGATSTAAVVRRSCTPTPQLEVTDTTQPQPMEVTRAAATTPAPFNPATAVVAPLPRRRHSSGALLRPRPLLASDLTTSSGMPLRRKRHLSDGSRDSTVMYRPCLDFEKMQKTVLRKPVPHGVNKVRIVKIKNFNGCKPAKPALSDPRAYSFRPIAATASPITPVEEPSFAY